MSHKDKAEAGHEINAVDGVRCSAREWCHPERTESRLGAQIFRDCGVEPVKGPEKATWPMGWIRTKKNQCLRNRGEYFQVQTARCAVE